MGGKVAGSCPEVLSAHESFPAVADAYHNHPLAAMAQTKV